MINLLILFILIITITLNLLLNDLTISCICFPLFSLTKLKKKMVSFLSIFSWCESWWFEFLFSFFNFSNRGVYRVL